MRKALVILGIVVAFVATSILSFQGGKMVAISGIKPQVDTIYHCDTIRLLQPTSTRVYVRDTMLVAIRDTMTRVVRDTMYLELPREVKEYRDTNYYARVSGFKPELEYLETYSSERVITKTLPLEKKLKPRFSIGLGIGYGMPVVSSGEVKPSPFVGVSLQYNLINMDFR